MIRFIFMAFATAVIWLPLWIAGLSVMSNLTPCRALMQEPPFPAICNYTLIFDVIIGLVCFILSASFVFSFVKHLGGKK